MLSEYPHCVEGLEDSKSEIGFVHDRRLRQLEAQQVWGDAVGSREGSVPERGRLDRAKNVPRHLPQSGLGVLRQTICGLG